ncbi:hypothetical protein L6Q96_00740 [Candidatus Binatia bacterium]|nr:hypothetical protein [Candidatus Binatia bacterium]
MKFDTVRHRSDLSAKAMQALRRLGVDAALQRAPDGALVGPAYELRATPGVRARLLFRRSADGGVEVGYATATGDGPWERIESEPFSLRALGYYERRLKRIGNFVETARNADRRPRVTPRRPA